ncbi:MAG: hypothetical protein ACI3W5_13905 [Faecousia sp.]
MQTYKFPQFSYPSSIRLSALLVLWSFGIILGAAAGGVASSESISLMRRALIAPVSIVSLFICVSLPFAFTAAAVLSGRSWLVYILCGLKGFSFAYTGSLCLVCFGDAGWLARALLLFSQIAVVPALWYVWLSLCKGKMHLGRCGFGLLPAYLITVALLDYFKVAPYLAGLSS